MCPGVLPLVLTVLLAVPPPAAAAPGAPRDLGDGLPVAAPAAAGLDAAALSGIERAAAGADLPKATSVLVVSRGSLVYERYLGGTGPETLQDTRSATKSVTSLAVGAAIADGKIASVADPVLAHFPEAARTPPDPLASGITVEDLLTMSSALDCNDDDEASPGNEEKMYPQQTWLTWVLAIPTRRVWQRDAAGRGPFSYCTAGAFLLGQLLQRATGEPVDAYVERRILAPLGIARREWPRSPSGEVQTGGGLRLRSRDLAKLGAMVADGGRWRGKVVVPSSWIDRALTVHRHAFGDLDYGYLFWRRDWATRCGPRSGWYMAGNGGNAVVVLRDLGAVIVVTRQAYNTRGMHQQTLRFIEGQVLPAFPCGAS
jgi:CubicO group peptidase (beta-lactamase class C family)